MNRRSFLSALSVAAAAFTLDAERLLWIPGKKTVFAPAAPAPKEFLWVSSDKIIRGPSFIYEFNFSGGDNGGTATLRRPSGNVLYHAGLAQHSHLVTTTFEPLVVPEGHQVYLGTTGDVRSALLINSTLKPSIGAIRADLSD